MELVLSDPETEHPKVWCDRQKLRQSLERLALGAVRRVESGGRVELSLRERSATRAYGSYHFIAHCSDMARPLNDQVFAAFARREITAASDAAGADLGLPIAKHVMELMGGTVDAQTLPDGGGLLTASLNLRLQETAAAHTAPSPEGERRVLVVEDNELNREIAQTILEETGFAVETAPDGTDAVEMVRRAGEFYYDAVLMDVQMPIMDGYEATRAIRALDDPQLANIPILAGYTLENLPVVLYVSAGVAGVGFCAYFLAMEHEPASVVSLVYFFKPALSPVLAWLIHKEEISQNMLIGIVSIVAGSLCAIIPGILESRKNAISS